MPYKFVNDERHEALEPDVRESEGLDLGRHALRTGVNIATQAVGLPGDILSLVNEYIARPISEKVAGGSVPYEETFLGKAIPTTEKHREALESLFGEKIKPRSEGERIADEVIEDATLLLNPSKLAVKGTKKALPIAKAFMKSIGANLVGETAKELGSGEQASAATKAGALFALSLMDTESAVKQVGNLYQQAEAALPEGAKTSASKLGADLHHLEHKITKGRPLENLSAPEKFVVDHAKKIEKLIQEGQIDVAQAWAQKRSLNQELDVLYSKFSDRKERKTIRSLAKNLNYYLNETLEQYGKKNPEFYKPFKDADEAFGTIARSNVISNWAKDMPIVQALKTPGLENLFVFAAPKASTAVLPYQGAKILYRIQQSPTLRDIYARSVKAAVSEDKVAFTKYVKALDKKLEEEEEKPRYRFIE